MVRLGYMHLLIKEHLLTLLDSLMVPRTECWFPRNSAHIGSKCGIYITRILNKLDVYISISLSIP